MKKVKTSSAKKLLLGKIKIAALSDEQQAALAGGSVTLPSDVICATQGSVCHTRTTCQTARC